MSTGVTFERSEMHRSDIRTGRVVHDKGELVTDTPVDGHRLRVDHMTPGVAGIGEQASVLHALVSSSPDHFYLYDRVGRHLYASPAAAQALGMEQGDFVGKTWNELGFPLEDTERFDIERECVFQHGYHWRGEMLLPTELGRPSSLHDYVLSPVRDADGCIEAVLVTARDITERKQEEAALQYQALHDALTGLANRALLNDRLEQSLLVARRSRRGLALLFLDLDAFKNVNDTVGHRGGDLLLQQVAARWRRVLRAADTLSRLGGDEFVVLLPDTGAVVAHDIGLRLGAEMEVPFEIEGRHFHLSVSRGIAVYEGGPMTANTLMAQGDQDMYRAKRQRHVDDVH